MMTKKICMICPAVTGHLNPMTAVGRQLQKRGHEVTMMALSDAEERVRQSGLNFTPFGCEAFPKGSVQEMTRRLGELEHAEALAFTVDHYRREAIALLSDFRRLSNEHHFDVVVTDQTMPGGSAAELTGLPFITLCIALMLNPEPTLPPWNTPWKYEISPTAVMRNEHGYQRSAAMVRPILDAVNDFRTAAGLSAIALPTSNLREGDSPLAIISQQPPSFDFPRTMLPPQFHYAGPFIEKGVGDDIEFPFERLDGRPLVYASMGTLQNRLTWVFRTMAEAAAKLPVQLVVTLGRKNSIPMRDLPGDPIVVPYAPQQRLLQHAVLTISHAGLNTVLESLSQGVPIVAIPITNDQPANASRIEWLGLGQVVPLQDLTSQSLCLVMESVLRNESYNLRAKAMQQEIAQLDGAKKAADMIESALSTSQPVLVDAAQ